MKKLTTAVALTMFVTAVPAAMALNTNRSANAAWNNSQSQRGNSGQARFRGMDRNGDGMITRDEWRGNDQSFRQLDRNGDGVITGDEARGNGKADGHGKSRGRGNGRMHQRADD